MDMTEFCKASVGSSILGAEPIEFECRNDMIKALVPVGGVIAEIGVFEGEFSRVLYDTVKPSRMYLVDIWEDGAVSSGDVNGNHVRTINGKDAYEKVLQSFDKEKTVLVLREPSATFLSQVQDDSLDMVYIDADHSYKGVLSDLRKSLHKVVPGGWIMGHDYSINKQKCKSYYDFGVKRAVTEFLNENPGLKLHAIANDGCTSFAIKKPQPVTDLSDSVVTTEEKSKIVVFSMSNREDVRTRSWPVLQNYCRKHDYIFRTFEPVDKDRHPSWSKLKLVHMLMIEYPSAQCFVWFDDDIIITNEEIKLETLLKGFFAEHSRVMAVQQDYYGQVFNMGVIAFKNVAVTWNLIDAIWDTCNEQTRYGMLWEQTATTHLWRNVKNVRNFIYILRPRTVQSFYRITDIDVYRWAPGDFAAHVLGTPDNQVRIQLMDMLLQSLRG